MGLQLIIYDTRQKLNLQVLTIDVIAAVWLITQRLLCLRFVHWWDQAIIVLIYPSNYLVSHHFEKHWVFQFCPSWMWGQIVHCNVYLILLTVQSLFLARLKTQNYHPISRTKNILELVENYIPIKNHDDSAAAYRAAIRG